MRRVTDEPKDMRNVIVVRAVEEHVKTAFYDFCRRYSVFVSTAETLVNGRGKDFEVYTSNAWDSFYLLPSSDETAVVVFAPENASREELSEIWLSLESYVMDMNTNISYEEIPESELSILSNVGVHTLVQFFSTEEYSFTVRGEFVDVTKKDMYALRDMVNCRLKAHTCSFAKKKVNDIEQITVKVTEGAFS